MLEPRGTTWAEAAWEDLPGQRSLDRFGGRQWQGFLPLVCRRHSSLPEERGDQGSVFAESGQVHQRLHALRVIIQIKFNYLTKK